MAEVDEDPTATILRRLAANELSLDEALAELANPTVEPDPIVEAQAEFAAAREKLIALGVNVTGTVSTEVTETVSEPDDDMAAELAAHQESEQ